MLSFASRTWDGWDYVPHALDHWLEGSDGVLLVATVGPPASGGQPLDHDGLPLEVGQVVAVARVALLSPTEAWLEGIRVDPRVRGMDVATELQVAELRMAKERGAAVVRYATGERNEASHRLGSRHGFELLTSLRTWSWREPGTADDSARHDEPTGYDADARAAASARRRRLLAALAETGHAARADEADRWWQWLSAAPTFLAQRRLYELRSWSVQELTESGFRAHLDRGEVIVARAAETTARALTILPAEALPAEEVTLHLALLVGEGAAVVRLVADVQRLAAGPIRFRLPVSAGTVDGPDEEALVAAGFVGREWLLDILGRPLDPAHPTPRWGKGLPGLFTGD